MTNDEYKRMSDLIENGDAGTQKEINLWLLNELNEIEEALTTLAAISKLNNITHDQLERYIDNMVYNVAFCVKADMTANGLDVTHINPDRYEHKEEDNGEATN